MDFGILWSGLGGIVTGLAGPAIKGYFTLKTQKNQYAHEENMVSAESTAAIAEINANVERDKVQGEVRIDEAVIGAMSTALKTADSDIMKESYIKYLAELPPMWGEKSFLGPWLAALVVVAIAFIDLFRKSIRPTLTTYLVGATTWITYLAHKLITAEGIAITVTFAEDLFRMVVYTVVYLTVTCVSFWFCDRAKEVKAKISAYL